MAPGEGPELSPSTEKKKKSRKSVKLRNRKQKSRLTYALGIKVTRMYVIMHIMIGDLELGSGKMPIPREQVTSQNIGEIQ
jgi:hypothetical protein